MPPFRDDHILIISPGSQTTLAQLGLPESFTPPKLRIPSRMFPGLEEGTWTFTKIREARDGEKEDLIAQAKGLRAAEAAVAAAASGGLGEVDDDDGDDDGDEDGDDEEGEVKEGELKEGGAKEGGAKEEEVKEGELRDEPAMVEKKEKVDTVVVDADELDEMDEDMGDGVYVEDEDDEEDAVWCIKEGRVVDWGCFFALLTYVHEMINPTFHTPILLVHPPEFTLEDKQQLTQFVFEKLKTPGFALLDSSVTALWAYGLSTSTVIDVGFEKTDITPISDFLIQDRARKTVHGCGGETITKHLCTLLPDMKPEDVEALKKSPICEILPLGTPLPGSTVDPSAIRMPPILISTTEEERDPLISEEDGTVNVAAIVASGKTHEFLAEREHARRGEAERRLPNRERETNTFWVIDKKRPGEEDDMSLSIPASALSSPVLTKAPDFPSPTTATAPAVPTDSMLISPTTATAPSLSPEDTEKRYRESSKRAQEQRARSEGIVLREDEIWRELTAGSERFRAAECGILTRIADALYDSISRVEDVSKRAELWDSLIIIGNGAKLRGFKDALLQTIFAKYIIPPSSGTIFSSELPTPTATGASTPQPPQAMPQPGGPNPLLVAATTQHLHHHHHSQMHHGERHSSHGQTPLSIKVAKMPDYFPEWKEVGFDEAGFLGAQVAAKVVFVVDQGANRGFMTRVEYNEMGPDAMAEIFL